MRKFMSILILLHVISSTMGLFTANVTAASVFSSVAAIILYGMAGLLGLFENKIGDASGACVILGCVLMACCLIDFCTDFFFSLRAAGGSGEFSAWFIVLGLALNIIVPLFYTLAFLIKPKKGDS